MLAQPAFVRCNFTFLRRATTPISRPRSRRQSSSIMAPPAVSFQPFFVPFSSHFFQPKAHSHIHFRYRNSKTLHEPIIADAMAVWRPSRRLGSCYSPSLPSHGFLTGPVKSLTLYMSLCIPGNRYGVHSLHSYSYFTTYVMRLGNRHVLEDQMPQADNSGNQCVDCRALHRSFIPNG